ncbi:MAG: hypothetical protein AB1749_06740 [Pseudomonadota bacterium]
MTQTNPSAGDGTLRSLTDAEMDVVAGGLAPFFAGYLVGVAATGVGIALVHAAGSLWDWLFD